MDLRFIGPVITELVRSFPRVELDGGRRAAYFTDYEFGDEPILPLHEAIEDELDFEVPFFATMQVLDEDMNEIKEQVVYLCNVPLMLGNGHFIIEGLERIVPPEIEQLPDGKWRTSGIERIFHDRLMAAMADVLFDLSERLIVTAWEELTPQDLLDTSLLAKAIRVIFDESAIEDDAYHDAADDCDCFFYEEDTESRLYDDVDVYTSRGDYEEDRSLGRRPKAFARYVISRKAVSMQ